jgi:hypothetical protein
MWECCKFVQQPNADCAYEDQEQNFSPIPHVQSFTQSVTSGAQPYLPIVYIPFSIVHFHCSILQLLAWADMTTL